jgi:hypothetical protein
MQKTSFAKYIHLLLLTCSIPLVILFPNFFSHASFGDTSKYEKIAKGKSYTFNIAPNYNFCSDPVDATQLTDGIYTSGYFWTQKTTVGWQKTSPIIITIDLGKIEPIRGVAFNTAAGTAGVTWPLSISILASDDGSKYFAVGDLIAISNKRESPSEKGYVVHQYWTDSLKTHGRYMQLVIEPGDPFCFVDEIEIYRGDDSWLSQQPMGESTPGGIEFFQTKTLNNSIKSRLNTDLRVARNEIKNSGLSEKEIFNLLEDLEGIENSISGLPSVAPRTFSAIFPINDLQARIYSTIAKMRQMEGAQPVEVWVSHPLDHLAPTQKFDSTSRKEINLAMMSGEWRSTVFNLANSLPNPAHIQFSIKGIPGGDNPDYVTVYEVQETDTTELKPIGAALKEMPRTKSGYSTIIPAGMTRQVWISFHPENIAFGNYKGQVAVVEDNGNKHEISLRFRLFPFVFPDKPSLHVGGWDYTDSDALYGVTANNRSALIAYLKDHFVDSPWATYRVMPFGSFDSHGNLTKKPDTSNFDSWVARWISARRFFVFLNVSDSIDGSKMESIDFNAKVKSWIDFWVDHIIAKGIKPEQFYLLLIDEPYKKNMDRTIIAWAKAIQAAQPKLMLWEDPTYLNPEDALTDMMSSVDVLCPNRTQLLSEGNHFIDFYRNQKSAGRNLDLYSCNGPMLLQDPYSYIRLQAWSCWEIGAESTFFWSFSDTGGGNPWNPYIEPRKYFSPLFLSPDTVISGKHMEALRESVEDFEYFVMLKDAIAKAEPENPALSKAKDLLQTGARRVLEDKNANQFDWINDKDRWIAEQVRMEILENLVALEYVGYDQGTEYVNNPALINGAHKK